MKPKPNKIRAVPAQAKPVKPRNPYLLPALALVLLTLAAYSNSFQGGFVVDNRGLLRDDSRVHEASPENIRLILDHTYWWPNGESGLYRPFTTLSYLFNYAILGNGEDLAGYHWINFFLHAGNVLLVYALALRLMRRRWPAFFVAALWAVHPVLTESVTNVAGRADLLAAGAVLAGFLMYLKSVEAQGWRRSAWLAGIALVTAIGAFSKESAVIVPGVIVLYEFIFRKERRWGRAQAMGLLATLVPLGLMLWQRARVLSTAPMEVQFTDNPIFGAHFLAGRLTALKVMAHYFQLILWPARLSADYSWPQIPLAQGTVPDWIVAIAVLAVIPATVLIYRRCEDKPELRAAFFFFWVGLAWLLPASNLLFPVGTIMAERLLYLTALGFVACLVPSIYAVASRLPSRDREAADPPARYATVLLCLLTAALATRTWVRNADWRDDLSMGYASARACPRSYKTHQWLATALYESDPSHRNIGHVIDEAARSLALLDPLPDPLKPPLTYVFVSSCYVAGKDYTKGIAVLNQFLDIEKTLPPNHTNQVRQAFAYLLISTAYRETGDQNRALDAAERSRAIDPFNPKVYLQLAVIAATTGRMDDAFVSLTEGNFVTSDENLMKALVDLYRSSTDPRGCVLVPGAGGPTMNPACDIVHAHICAASPRVVRTLAAGGQGDVAQARKKMFIEEFGCPKRPIDEAMP